MIAAQSGRSRARLWFVALLIALATVISGWLFLAFVQASIGLFVQRQEPGVSGWVILNAGVVGYLFVSLATRLLRRDFILPSGRHLAVNMLAGYGRGWLIGIGALGARSFVDVIRSNASPPSGSWAADAVFFLLALLVLAIPGLLALALANGLRSRSG